MKISMGFLIVIIKLIVKFIWGAVEIWVAQTTLTNMNKCRIDSLFESKSFYINYKSLVLVKKYPCKQSGTLTDMVDWILPKVQKTLSVHITIFSKEKAGAIGHMKLEYEIPAILHRIWSGNERVTWMINLKLSRS